MSANHKSGYSNRLSRQSSPYLLQHANNPVDWFPWGPEAFEKARREDKPIFLSIGYSTCHWCHVMAHESFENDRIAGVLNANFVSVKVDREERPDIDAIYMDFVQALTGAGGWPMSVFLTPDGKPFYGGTYFPPVDRYGRPGFERLLMTIVHNWQSCRQEILVSADQITAAMKNQMQNIQLDGQINAEILDKTYRVLERNFDVQNGGFVSAPKFPQPGFLAFLLAWHHRSNEPNSLRMVEKSLIEMAKGGIYDHLGGGFHRYSVDERWQVPHFEKMLYDQALLSKVYLHTWQITGNRMYEKTAREVLDYVLRDMTDPGGGFYSAEDADSEAREGLFYVWKQEEIHTVLTREEEQLVKAYYHVTEEGNFEEGQNILHIVQSLEEIAGRQGLSTEEADRILHNARRKLFEIRQKRPRPGRDEKMISGWNGLMLSSLAVGGAVLDEPRYIRAAQKNADFILNTLCSDDRLKRYAAGGAGHGPAVLDDYAFLIGGLLDLYEADFDPQWLNHAIHLSERMSELFEDPQGGGFFLTGKDAEALVVHSKPGYDGALPSGNSEAARVYLRLGMFTGREVFAQKGQKILAAFSEKLDNQGTAFPDMLSAVDLALGPRSEIVIAADPEHPDARKMIREVRRRYLPRSVLLLHEPGARGELIRSLCGFIGGQVPHHGRPTVYLCRDFVCTTPMTELEDLQTVLADC